jgi:hypothetical protein
MRLRRSLLAAALLIWTVPAWASAPRVSLLAPGAGDVLEGGGQAILTWSAASLPERVEEWEAFLSIDDGASYPIRITPHLDSEIRTFQWRVPNITASRVRLLLRFGNESEEHVVEVQQSFTIAAQADARAASVLEISPAAETGEAALPGGAPCVEWVSGDRAGGNLVTHRRHDTTVGAIGARLQYGPLNEEIAPGKEPASPAQPPVSPAQDSGQRASLPVAARAAARPLLLFLTRLNI